MHFEEGPEFRRDKNHKAKPSLQALVVSVHTRLSIFIVCVNCMGGPNLAIVYDDDNDVVLVG